MPHAPLLSERSREAQIMLAAIVPFLFGAVTGLALGASAWLYWVLSALAAIGGILAGHEHPDGRSGARRGILGGALFGAGILIMHAITGAEEKVSLGDVPILLIVITAFIGMLLGALGGHLRGRSAGAA